MSASKASKSGAAPKPSALPEDFQERVFRAIAVQRPAVAAYIKEVRRKNPSATPAQVMKTIESQYVATTTLASAAVGATATIPAVGIPVAIGLGVADLLFFYETTALFALCMAELRGIPMDDPDRAKAVVLGALLGEKRRSKVTELIFSVLPVGSTVAGARAAAGKVASGVAPRWGELLAEHLPDSALVPVTMVLAKKAIAQGAVIGTVKISTKVIPVVGAVAGGATSFYFGSGVVKSCRAGFSAPVQSWPTWLELTDTDLDGVRNPSKAVQAMRFASASAQDFGEGVWKRVAAATAMFRSVDLDDDGARQAPRAVTVIKGAATAVGGAAGGAAKAVGSTASSAAGAVAGTFKRDQSDEGVLGSDDDPGTDPLDASAG